MDPSCGKSRDHESRAQGTTSTEDVALRQMSPRESKRRSQGKSRADRGGFSKRSAGGWRSQMPLSGQGDNHRDLGTGFGNEAVAGSLCEEGFSGRMGVETDGRRLKS